MSNEKKYDKLAVSEVFYSIQGEGPTTGFPAVFLRLGGCNLLCESASWRCDTIEVWTKSKATPFEEVIPEQWALKLQLGAHLVITGGEPMMHQAQIVQYLQWFLSKYGFIPYVEIETNGTITPTIQMLEVVRQWNVSPKLSSVGEKNTDKMRINAQALNVLKLTELSVFKFVISSEADFEEVIDVFVPTIGIHKLMLMPAGATQLELEETRPLVAELCKKHMIRFSDRMHISIWDRKTGV